MIDFQVGDRVILIDDRDYPPNLRAGVAKGHLGTVVNVDKWHSTDTAPYLVEWDGVEFDDSAWTFSTRLAPAPVKDNIRRFSTGAVRDTAEGKPRMGLLPLDLLKRVAQYYQIGAEKYEADNWRKGQPKDATMDSLLRHLESYRRGEADEDHLSAVVWNALSMMHVDEYLLREHPELDFHYKYPKKEKQNEIYK